MNKVANFDFIPMKGYNDLVFNFQEKEKVKFYRFKIYTFDTPNFILNSELLIWFYAFWIFFAPLIVILKNF